MGVAECGQWMDSGNWHIRFGNHFLKLFFSSAIILISMANVEGGVAEDLSDYIPNVCTSSPEYGHFVKGTVNLYLYLATLGNCVHFSKAVQIRM